MLSHWLERWGSIGFDEMKSLLEIALDAAKCNDPRTQGFHLALAISCFSVSALMVGILGRLLVPWVPGPWGKWHQDPPGHGLLEMSTARLD